MKTEEASYGTTEVTKGVRRQPEPVEIDISMRGSVIAWLKELEQDQNRW
jgi:hypothetical protein